MEKILGGRLPRVVSQPPTQSSISTKIFSTWNPTLGEFSIFSNLDTNKIVKIAGKQQTKVFICKALGQFVATLPTALLIPYLRLYQQIKLKINLWLVVNKKSRRDANADC